MALFWDGEVVDLDGCSVFGWMVVLSERFI